MISGAVLQTEEFSATRLMYQMKVRCLVKNVLNVSDFLFKSFCLTDTTFTEIIQQFTLCLLRD